MIHQLEQEKPQFDVKDIPPESQRVTIYDEVNYIEPGIAYFPGLQDSLIHGFTWGEGIPNYSYAKEPEYPDETSIEAVRSRIQELLAKMGANYDRRVLFQSLVHAEGILDIDTEYLASQTSDIRGIYTEGGAFFTRESNIPFTTTSGDCRYAIVYAESPDGPVAGIIHGSRNQLDRRLPQRAMHHLIYRYGVLPESIRAGITPGISRKFHTLQLNGLRDRVGWGKHLVLDNEGTIHLDSLGYFIEQLQEAGVNNIEAYGEELCTYQATQSGYLNASDRYAWDTGTKTGRLLAVTQLRSNAES